MKIPTIALLSIVLSSGLLCLTSAFSPSVPRTTGFGVVKSSIKTSSVSKHSLLTYDRATRRSLAAMDDDEDDSSEDEEEPLSKGINSVSWLPTVIGAKGETITGIRNGAEVLPLFPLGGIVYTPNSEHILNIFEPRYRQMYTDILMNGTKRFVVAMSHPTESGRFAKTGVLFELEDLKEVSEQTADQIKYICNHRVTGRVNLHRVINPEAWEARDTYLRVEGTITDDTGKDVAEATDDVYGAVALAAKGAPQEEKALKESFAALVKIQHELEEDVRFTRASVNSFATGPGADELGLWQSIRLWQSYADQRLMARQNELQSDFQEKLQNFLKQEKGLKDEEIPSAIGFQDLSPALQKEVQELQKRMAVELQPLVLESTLTMQKILEADDHKARCNLLRHFIDAERKRLSAKKTLRGMFAGDASSLLTAEPPLPSEADKGNDDLTSQRSIFTDEPDAFQ